MSLRSAFLDVVRNRASNTALIFEGEAYSYERLAEESQKMVALQKKRGHTAGDLYISEEPNGPVLLSEFFACVFNELVFCPVFERKNAVEKKKLRQDLQGKSLPGHSGVIFQSSGSTGQPKYIFQPFANILKNALLSSQEQGLCTHTRSYSTLPFSHTGGMNMQTLPTLLSGGTVHWDKSFTAPRALLALKDSNTAVMVPTQLESLFRHSSWKTFNFNQGTHILTGSMCVPESIFQSLSEKQATVFNVYGLTEVGPFVCVQKKWRPLPMKALSGLGVPLLPYEINLDSKTSEIQVQGPCVGKKLIVTEDGGLELEELGAVQTGDIGLFDRGELFFCGRLLRRINTSGMKYSPEEVEMTIKQHPGVYDAYVDKKRSQTFGEVGIAYVEGNIKASELRDFLRARLSSYKIPREFKFVDKLERSDIDKPRVTPRPREKS